MEANIQDTFTSSQRICFEKISVIISRVAVSILQLAELKTQDLKQWKCKHFFYCHDNLVA